MSDTWVIRAASRDDAGDLVRLLAQLGYPANPTTLIGRLGRLEATGLDQVLLAEDADEQVIGLLVLHIIPALLQEDAPLAHITALVVDASAARRGVGRALVAEAEALARQVGCDRIEVGSNRARVAAHAFYTALGYFQSHTLFRKTFS